MFEDIYQHLCNFMDLETVTRTTEMQYDEYKFTDPDECMGTMSELCRYLYEHTSASVKVELLIDYDNEDYRITISDV